jgi:hypothetical protein
MCFGHRMHGPDSYLVNQRCEVPSNQPDQMPQSALCEAGSEEASSACEWVRVSVSVGERANPFADTPALCHTLIGR